LKTDREIVQIMIVRWIGDALQSRVVGGKASDERLSHGGQAGHRSTKGYPNPGDERKLLCGSGNGKDLEY
jgi:hypothetical protein